MSATSCSGWLLTMHTFPFVPTLAMTALGMVWPGGMQPGMGDDLCPTAFNIGLQRAVTVHFASALPVDLPDVSQHQERQTRRAIQRIRASAHPRPLKDQG